VTPILAEDQALLRDLSAAPRPTGSEAIARARDRCAHALRELGYNVVEHRFEFSELPGRFGTPLMGAAGAFIVGVAGQLGVAGTGSSPLIVVTAGALALFMVGRWMIRRGVLVAPVLRAGGINLEATRPGPEPTIWLCAHLDTKSQPIPSLVRSAAILVEALGLVLTAALALVAALGVHVDELYWGMAAAVTLLGAVPVVLSTTGSSSPGALDNASGVTTVIAAARQLGHEPGLGVLITDAEELGLAGARAWACEDFPLTMLNCDGVDDEGNIEVMFSGKRPTPLLDAVARASHSTAIARHSRRLALGILTDSVAFTDGGLASVTFSRGSLRSLARVHSRRDDLAHLRGSGIRDTAALIAATVRELRHDRDMMIH
jgi:hypothetical protein